MMSDFLEAIGRVLVEAFIWITIFIYFFMFGALKASDIYEIKEIQDVREVENGYYITINDEIYYKEVEKDE